MSGVSETTEKMSTILQTAFLKLIFLYVRYSVLFKISLKLLPKEQVNNMSALVQVIAWHTIDEKPSFETMLTTFTDAYTRDSVSMS